MTATLPDTLKVQLAQAAGIDEKAEIRLPADDPLLDETRRQICIHDGCIEDEAISSLIQEQLAAGKRVAVVCNTVNKAMSMREALWEYEPYLVHSRFTLGDRAKRETKERLSKERLVISTQVIEVSLDVSFDVMFTELAPADALLQRFGRVNRHSDSPYQAPVWICCGEDAGSQMIYDPELLETTAQWARAFADSKGQLNFEASRDWMQAVYPHGLTAKENAAMTDAQQKFRSVVQNLKPMLDPVVDPDLETTLFETIQVVPSGCEKGLEKAVGEKNYLRAKEMLVAVNLRSWFGAEWRTRKQGLPHVRERANLHPTRPYRIALFRYSSEAGLNLNMPIDESGSNFY